MERFTRGMKYPTVAELILQLQAMDPDLLVTGLDMSGFAVPVPTVAPVLMERGGLLHQLHCERDATEPTHRVDVVVL